MPRWLALISLLCLALPTYAVTPATLIAPDLNAQRVEVTSLDGDTLNYFDADRTLRSSHIDRLVQLRIAGGDELANASNLPSVWLTNGQRIAGEWIGPTDDGSGLVWRHDLIGSVVVPLEAIAGVSLVVSDSAATHRDVPTSDIVTLINGDALTGFVASLTPAGVSLVPESGREAVTIPYAWIASMRLSNPKADVIEPSHRITLTDGTRILAEQLQISGGVLSCRIAPAGAAPKAIQVPIDGLARIDFWAGGLRLIDLVELPMRATDKGYVFGLPVPMRVAGRSIRMHAPDEVAIDLPDGSQRFAAVAELDTQDAPATITDWSDFEVVLTSGTDGATRFGVSGTQPRVRINTPIAAPVLTLRLDPGVNGPILDRMLLRDAVILVRTPGSGPSDDNGR